MPPRKKVRIIHDLTANQLAELLGLKVSAVIKALFMQGIRRTVHQIVEVNTARKLALDMGFQLGDDDEGDPPDEHTAPVPRTPIIPEGGNEVAIPEPDSEEEP